MKCFRAKVDPQDVVGIDIHCNLVKSTNELVRGDALVLPFQSESFQLVTMISLIEHVSDQVAYLSESVRLTGTDGELFILVPNRRFLVELHSSLFFFCLPRRFRLLVVRITAIVRNERIRDLLLARRI